MTETHLRSLTKGITWRVVATLATTGLVYFATGNIQIALGVGILDVFIKFVLYYLHERAWITIPWGTSVGSKK